METKCPACGVDLRKNGIGYNRRGSITYHFSVSNSKLIREQFDMFSKKDGVFFCRDCDEDLDLSGDEVLKILS